VLPGKTYAPEDFLRIAGRRKWAIILPFVLIALATLVVAHYLPNRYRSETVILVVPQQVPESYVRSTITSRIEDRLQSISQQILSRTRLERIIQDFNLYERERQIGIMEDVIEKMRTRDIRVETLKGDAFRIAFIGDNPVTVMRVTDRLASHFIDENLRDREVLAQGTSQFLTVQLEDARRRLIEQEKKLEGYKLRHSGELPSQAAGNLQQIQNLQVQVQNVNESLNRDVDRKLIIERALADVRAVDVQALASAAASGNDANQPVSVQLAIAEKTLSEMQLRLTQQHPDIIRLKRRINGLKQRAEAESLEAPLSPESSAPTTPAQVLQRNREKALLAELESLDRQITYKRAEELRLRKVAAGYQARIEAVPARETELAELTRDHATVQKMYTDLLAKNEESKISANLERRQIGEQFKILDSARPAEKPFSPNRILINLLGAVGGLMAGFALAALLEYRDASFRSQDEVSIVLLLPVLAQIPLISTPAELRHMRRKRLIIAAAAVLAFVAVTAALWRIGVFNGLLRTVWYV
jgi:polysaccharide chain length determinant protein (PEP-CTERM system associated)